MDADRISVSTAIASTHDYLVVGSEFARHGVKRMWECCSCHGNFELRWCKGMKNIWYKQIFRGVFVLFCKNSVNYDTYDNRHFKRCVPTLFSSENLMFMLNLLHKWAIKQFQNFWVYLFRFIDNFTLLSICPLTCLKIHLLSPFMIARICSFLWELAAKIWDFV